VRQEIDRLPGNVRQRIKRTIVGLAFEPRPANASELEDELAGFWRTRLDDYRIIYSIDDEKENMIQVPLNQVTEELSRDLRLAEQEDIITRHGVPAGILIGFEDHETWWEELLLRDPRFRERVTQARGSLGEGKGISICGQHSAQPHLRTRPRHPGPPTSWPLRYKPCRGDLT
jgi:mRNA-degrading endonuclease RelE of RelBE toxin-antitoxin system